MNHNSMPICRTFERALAIANSMAADTGRRWRVRQSGRFGHLWVAHETDQPVTIRKTNTNEENR